MIAMTKYYIHDGTSQQGPFQIEDLKQRAISKNTLIWCEGMTEWTTAGTVAELQSIFASSPPPPLKQNESREKKNNRAGMIAGLTLLGVLALIGFVMIGNNPNGVPGVKIEINTPKPIVVTSRADGSKSGLFNARTTVYATVLNQGGVGNVLVTFFCMQGGRTFDQSKSIYLSEGQSQDLEVTFEEVNYIDGKITYRVETKAQ